MKKALALLVTAIMLFTSVSVALGAFEDSPKPSHWVYDQFMLVYNSGLLKGYPDGTFKGERHATRYEMVELTARVLRLFEARLAEVKSEPATPVEPATEVCLTEEQVRAIIAEELADVDAGELYRAIKALEEEFRADLDAMDVRVTLLETKVAELEQKVDTVAKDTRSAKIFAIIGIILGLAGIALP
ncbi:MAG: S-layer homology domain-containing protein [Firmicutes bacterium]|nr:S-layer homology domain-containing protein [Bacillota bacterium]